MLQAVEVGLLQGLVDVEVGALAQRGWLGRGLRGVGARPGGEVVQAALWPTGPVGAADAAAAAAAAVTARRLGNPVARRAWWAPVHGVTENQDRTPPSHTIKQQLQ